MAFDVDRWMTAVLASAYGSITSEQLSEISGLIEDDYLTADIEYLMAQIDADLVEHDREKAECELRRGGVRPRHVSLANAFKHWYAHAEPVVRAEVRAIKRQGRIHLRFPRHPPLRGTIARNQLRISAVRDGKSYEFYSGVPCRPKPVEGGVICQFCCGATVFKDAEALWDDHIFAEIANIAVSLSRSSRLSFVEGCKQSYVMLD